MIWIQNVSLALNDKVVENGALGIEGTKISVIGLQTDASPEGAQVIDGGGAVLAPGFIELQINGAFGKDFTEDPESIWTVAERLPEHGVTAFLPTVITSPAETIEYAQKVITSGPSADFRGAWPLGLHLEGPFLNPGKKGAHNPIYISQPDSRMAAGWSIENGVRLVTLAPELPGALDLARELIGRGVVVSAGHSLASYEEAKAGFAAGIRCGTHLFNAQPALDHRQPGLIGALLDEPGVVCGLIADGVHVHPVMIRLAWQMKGVQRLALVTDAMAALGMPAGRYVLGDFEVTVDGSSARLSNGTLAGSILRMDEALRNLMEFTGCTLYEALPALTSTPAGLLGLSDKGVLRPGADADLVLLSPSGDLLSTWVTGQQVYSAA